MNIWFRIAELNQSQDKAIFALSSLFTLRVINFFVLEGSMTICTTYLGDLICFGENPRKMTLLSYSFDTSRGAARGDIFARHLAAHQRIWN